MANKSRIRIMPLCMVILCFHACVEHGMYIHIEHPFIRFINQSDDTVWVEWNPRYPMSETDSLFSGFQVRIKNNDSFDLMPLKSECWEGELKKNPFVRIFLFDAPYNSISNNPDSLLRFQQEHLIDMHWYTKKELDSLNWTIHFPIQ